MDVSIEGVSKQYGATVALDGVDLRFGADDHLLLAGANGAGKSTLLRLLTGLTGPSHGRVRIDDHDPRTHVDVRRRIGLLSHQILLYDDLTATENLHFFARLYGVSIAVDEILARANLVAQANLPVSGFSRGMKQRLALARATLHNPQLLLLDEPFTGLDRHAAAALGRELTLRVQQPGTMSVMITHNVPEAASIATCVVVLRRGRIVHQQSWHGDDGDQLQALCDHYLEA